jgi:hypothetical protein
VSQGHEQVSRAIDAALLIAGHQLGHAQGLISNLLGSMSALFGGSIEY